jgi:putative nucleotidyltransferase with HDIG domain
VGAIPTRKSKRTYVGSVIATGAAVVGLSLWQLSHQAPGPEWFILAALTLFTGSFTVRLPSLPAKISVSETFVFTSVLLFGPAAGTITVVLDALVISLWMQPMHRSMVRVAFNATAPAIAIRVASEAFLFLCGIEPGHINRDDVGALIAPAFAFALLYFLINTGLVAGALASERDESPFAIWYAHFPAVSISYFVGSSIAMLIVAYTDRIDLTVLSIIVPLLLVSYLTFRTSMGRLADANKHLAQVNELYLSTVETLAMAVDAKDQITHGHIRRVQSFATELARRLGVSNAEQLKAIEAAALLHDMGKLGIPEHILNKPGKLTSAEFDKMKRHADIGADLLSSIRFPYPVVPIVRHHHESWDGSGYPTGISGTDIPLGARILSVVDCFDALTSDRPYRPRLSNDEAFAILRQRRGSMYDPLVVDTFISSYELIAPTAILAGQQATSIMSGLETTPDRVRGPLSNIRATAAQSLTLAECAREMKRCSTERELLATASQYLRLLTPATVCVFYKYMAETDTVCCTDAAGDPAGLISGLTIKVGERISGWAAANTNIIANSDATLDLVGVADRFTPPLRSAVAGPLMRESSLFGVLTVYAPDDNCFSEDHRYAFERIAAAISERLGSTVTTSSQSASIVRFRAAERR